jgi:hypothetical protein
MKIYWTRDSVPELADLPPRERRRLWRECWGKVLWHWPVLLVGFVLLPALLGGALYLTGYLALAVGLGWPLALLLASGVFGATYGFILEQVSIPIARPYLRAARDATQQSGEPAEPGAAPDPGRT